MTKGYKAFDKGLICKGHKYEVGKTYEMSENEIELCKKGFHFCVNPLDTLNYYDLFGTEFCEVEGMGKELKNDADSKICTNKITINAKIDFKSLVKTSIDFVMDLCKKDDNNKNSAQLASSGDYAQLASSGDYAKLASSGDYAKLASSGYSAKLASSGYYAKLASSGEHSVIAGIGIANIAKGIKGNWIVLAEWVYDNKLNRNIPKHVKSVKIDGKKIKENVWYKLEKGKFKEVK